MIVYDCTHTRICTYMYSSFWRVIYMQVVCQRGAIENRSWKDLKVGDIVRVNRGQPLPADVVQLSSSEEQGNSYIDTCDLDGETNLKIKSSLSVTVHAIKAADVAALRGQMQYEAPNKRLYTFVGKITVNGETIAVDNDAVLLRGAVARIFRWKQVPSCVCVRGMTKCDYDVLMFPMYQ